MKATFGNLSSKTQNLKDKGEKIKMKSQMFQGRFLITIFVVLAMLWIPQLALAAWPTDPAVNVPICTEAGDQIMESNGKNDSSISDGSGGAIIVWQDERDGNSDIYARRVDGFGNVLWTVDGVAICTDSETQIYPLAVSDDSGGAIIVWQDERDGNWDIYAQRVDSGGALLWGTDPATDGVVVSSSTFDQEYPLAVSDGSGGVVISWLDNRSGNPDIYAQRVDASGTVLWASDAPICTDPSDDLNINSSHITSDGSGGAIIAWSDDPYGNIHAQRVDASGNILWTGGVAITSGVNNNYPSIASDGSGGAFIIWNAMRNAPTSWDIYAQRIDSSGNTLWAADGIPI